jgi:hypothetical protein
MAPWMGDGTSTPSAQFQRLSQATQGDGARYSHIPM